MQITKGKRGVYIKLDNMPTKDELLTLNKLAGFNAYRIDTSRGYARLLCKMCPTLCSVEMECPIGEKFRI